jgi:hypothetical protein
MAKLNNVWNYLGSTLDNFKAALLGYRTYKAALTQFGSDPPTAKVLENTLGITLEFEYDVEGQYYALINKAFFNSGTQSYLGTQVEVTITPQSSVVDNTVLQYAAFPVFFYVIGITVTSDGTPKNGLLGNYYTTILEIKVYNK